MSDRKLNFFAGPSVLPVEVLDEMQSQIKDYQGNGQSMIETSHRGAMFEGMYNKCLSSMRELLGISSDYDVYFLGGGATLQFAMIPMNFLKPGTHADYIKSGTWANKAGKDAEVFGDVKYYFDGTDSKFTTLPDPKTVHASKNSSYLYLCSNETIGGIEWQDFPKREDTPIIADMSSDFLSRPVDVNNFDMIYGGVQKNLGPAGATVIIMKKDMLKRANSPLPNYLNYANHSSKDGLFNTPPVFSIWGVQLVLEWIKKNGGAQGMKERATLKSKMVYDVLDSSDFWKSPVDSRYRSKMNVVFRLPSEDLEKKFLTEAAQNDMLGLKGHRSVGGLRASIYNSCPEEDVKTLTEFMKEFERKNG